MQIKICGVRSVADARACVAASADLAGLNFVGASRRCVGQDVAAIRDALGPVTPVGVFADAALEAIERHARSLDLTWIQLHGQEPPALCAALAPYQVIKALDHDALTNAERLRAYAPHVSAFLVDGRVPGSGRPWDVAALAPLVRQGRLLDRPVFVAGGLTPENVSAVINAVGPHGVDVASGIEVDGRPNSGRIAAFCLAARRPRKEAA